jgi:hypothetical protein
VTNTTEPPAREGGKKVEDRFAELCRQLKNEAGVI